MSTTLAVTLDQQWKANIYAQIKDRNKAQSIGYAQIIKQCNAALKREKEWRNQVSALEKQLLLLRSESSAQGGQSKGDAARIDAQKSIDAARSVEDLAAYKRYAETAQMLIDANQKATRAEEDKKQKEAELIQLKAQLAEEKAMYIALAEKMQESEKSVQLLKTELTTTKDSTSTLQARNIQLENENMQLVERWMKKMAEEAEKMNTANQFYGEMLEAQRRTEVINKVSPNAPGPMNNVNVNAPIVKKLAFFDSVSFVDCSAILPSKARRKLSGHSGEVTCVAFSKSGLVMASGGVDKTVRLWDAPTGSPKSTFSGFTQSVMCVQFSPSDEFIVGASNDNSCRVWGVDNGRLRHTLTGHIGKVYSAAFADSHKLFTGSHDRTIKMWDLGKGYSTRTIFCFSSLNDLVVAPDMLVSGHMDHQLRFWDAKSTEVVHTMEQLHEGPITSVSLTTDGTKVLTNSRDNTLKLIDIRTHEVVLTYKDDAYRNGLSWTRACISPDNRYVAAGSADGTVVFWNGATAKLEKTIPNVHTSAVAACSWSLLGTQFATAGDKDKMIVMWD